MSKQVARAQRINEWLEHLQRWETAGGSLASYATEHGFVRTHTGAVLFFRLMSRRYERASTVLTSNKDFEQWGEVLGDDVMAAALIDRDSHCHLVNIRGNSYRMREHTALHQSLLQSETSESVVTARRSRRSKASAH